MMIKRVYTLKALLTVLGTLLVLNVSCYYTYMVCIVKDRMCGNTLVYHRILSYTQGSTMQGSTRKLPTPFIPMFLHYLGLSLHLYNQISLLPLILSQRNLWFLQSNRPRFKSQNIRDHFSDSSIVKCV